MGRTARNRALLVSAAVILLSMTAIVGVTVALFTDTVMVKNHLQAGDLNITLVRTKLESYAIDDKTGYMTTTEDSTTVDFSNSTTENVFGITDTTRIVPGSIYTATMEISNNTETSDVAYNYWLEVKLITDDLTTEELMALKLDEQLKITVVSEAGTVSKMLDEGMTVGNSVTPIGTLALAESDTFTVSMEFVDGAGNNAAKAQTLQFDLIVHAVQRTTAPTTP